MKCYEQGIEKHITITFTRSSQKADLLHLNYLRTSSTSSITVRQRVTIYNSLTRKSRPTHYSALHHKNSTAYHIMTSRITPTRPLRNTLSLYLMWSVIFIGHLWSVLGTCFISSPSTATDLCAINSSWPSWYPPTPTRSKHLAGRAETTQVTDNRGQVTCRPVTSPLIDVRYYPTLTMTVKPIILNK